MPRQYRPKEVITPTTMPDQLLYEQMANKPKTTVKYQAYCYSSWLYEGNSSVRTGNEINLTQITKRADIFILGITYDVDQIEFTYLFSSA